jgi:CubicO group peptidase (beta-lactamase class C family)
MRKTPARVAVLILAAVTAVMAADNSPPALADVIQQAAAKLPAGSIVAAELDHGRVRFTGAGDYVPRAGVPPEKVLFEIGSITKVFTGLLLAKTVNEGKARLDDSIAKYLPADLNLAPQLAAITLEQLATHTSGLPRLPDNFKRTDPLDPYADYTTADLYAFLAAYRPAKPAPRPTDYSNLGMGLLGHILERIHGRSYVELVAERITGPLGLKDTVIELDPDQQTRFAVPHSGSTTVKPWHNPGLAGAGGLCSTAADLASFVTALMNPGDSPLRAAWALARQPRASLGWQKLGLAIMIDKHDAELTYWHSGGTGGSRSYLGFSPDTQRGLVILLDNDTREGESIAAALEPPRAVAANPARQSEIPLPPGKAAEFTGVYAVDAHIRFTVLPGDTGRLQVRFTGQPFAPVFFAGHDRFFLRIMPAEYQFGRDAGGHVVSLALLQNGREMTAPRIDEPLPTVLPTTKAELQAYVGTYNLPAEPGLPPSAQFKIVVHLGTLFAMRTGQPESPVFKDRADHFVYDTVEAGLTFERDAGGKVTALVLCQNGRDWRATRAAP